MRYLIAYVFAVIADLCYSLHVFALGREWVTLCLTSGFILPFTHLLGAIWFVTAKNNRERFWLTACSAAGVVSGTGMVLWMFG